MNGSGHDLRKKDASMNAHARQQDAVSARAEEPTERHGRIRHDPAGIAQPVAPLSRDGGASDRIAAAPGHDTPHGVPSSGTPARPRLQRRLLAGALVLVAVLAAWLLPRDPAAPVAASAPRTLELAAADVATVQPRIIERMLFLSGTVAPYVQATVKSKVAGEVRQVTVREGQDVEQGQVIARIDTRNLQAQYDREVAAVDKARAELELATLNRDKNRSLLEQRYISRNTYETTESAYAASVASYKLAEAQARVARIGLEDATIRAPFTGTIAARLVQPGEKVSPDTSIVSLVDLRHMVLEAAVPAADIPSVAVGQRARFTVGGFGDREFVGAVQRINPLTTNGSRAITIYVAVDNADRALKGGMFAQGTLTLNSTQPVLSVQHRAVREDAGAFYVLVLKDGRIVRTPVVLGPRLEGEEFVEVRSGLGAGEQIILAELSDSQAGSEAIVRGASPGGS